MNQYDKDFDKWMDDLRKKDIRPKDFPTIPETPFGSIADKAIDKINYLLDVLRFGTKK